MIPNAIETAKDAMLRTYAAQLRMERPGLTHARSFQIAQEQHPELREEYGPTSDSTYPYQPAAGSQLDELLERYVKKYRYRPTARKPFVHKPFPEERQKVEAKKPAAEIDKRDCILVYASTGELVDIELA